VIVAAVARLGLFKGKNKTTVKKKPGRNWEVEQPGFRALGTLARRGAALQNSMLLPLQCSERQSLRTIPNRASGNAAEGLPIVGAIAVPMLPIAIVVLVLMVVF
jgi:hypothetical protein